MLANPKWHLGRVGFLSPAEFLCNVAAFLCNPVWPATLSRICQKERKFPMTDQVEPDFPPHLAVWDPAVFPDQRDWHYARVRFAPHLARRELEAAAWIGRGGNDDDR